MRSLRLIRYQTQYQEQVLELHRSAMEGFTTGISQHDEEADLMAVEQVYLGGGGEFLIGILDDKVVAMGGFVRLSDTTAELRRMRIQKELQGQGYGAQLLRELEQLAYIQGIRTLCLKTAIARPLTLEFYRKHGYQETDRGFYGEVEIVGFSKRFDAVKTRAC
ncbi:MAG: GNAT family N-acetyltransferase [Thermoguttaceae bacterium]